MKYLMKSYLIFVGHHNDYPRFEITLRSFSPLKWFAVRTDEGLREQICKLKDRIEMDLSYFESFNESHLPPLLRPSGSLTSSPVDSNPDQVLEIYVWTSEDPVKRRIA